MKFLNFLLCFFLLALPSLAGDDLQDLRIILDMNLYVDERASAASTALSAGKVSPQAAAARWRELHSMATSLKKDSLGAERADLPEVAKEVSQMMRLQILRLEGLMEAADVEAKQGLAQARPLWTAQLKTLQDYKKQEAVVKDLLNRLKE